MKVEDTMSYRLKLVAKSFALKVNKKKLLFRFDLQHPSIDQTLEQEYHDLVWAKKTKLIEQPMV
jgi:hypothetical protein